MDDLNTMLDLGACESDEIKVNVAKIFACYCSMGKYNPFTFSDFDPSKTMGLCGDERKSSCGESCEYFVKSLKEIDRDVLEAELAEDYEDVKDGLMEIYDRIHNA